MGTSERKKRKSAGRELRRLGDAPASEELGGHLERVRKKKGSQREIFRLSARVHGTGMLPDSVIVGAKKGGTNGYLSRSVYAEQLLRWWEFFDREQILALRSETFFEDPVSVLKHVLGFLGLPAWEPDKAEARNEGNYDQTNPAIGRRLKIFFDPYNRKLYDLLGTNFDW